MHEIHGLIGDLKADIKTYTYDGDTPDDARQAIRKQGHVVVTNPDMLHAGILPHHTKWQKLFANLKFVVIDELHVYRGVFGSHLTNVIRGASSGYAVSTARTPFLSAVPPPSPIPGSTPSGSWNGPWH